MGSNPTLSARLRSYELRQAQPHISLAKSVRRSPTGRRRTGTIMYYVYLLKSINHSDQIYIGFTLDLKERLKVHNAGGSTHTAKYKPWLLHAYFAFSTKKQALDFEKYLKSHSGRAFASKPFWE